MVDWQPAWKNGYGLRARLSGCRLHGIVLPRRTRRVGTGVCVVCLDLGGLDDVTARLGWSIAWHTLLQGKANGDRGILWVRGRIQQQLRSLGRYLDTHAGKFLFVSLLAVATFAVGLKSATFHSNIEQLWAEPAAAEDSPQSEVLSTHQMVIQTSIDPDANVLHQHGLLEHLELVKRATQVTVNMFDLTWRLKDLCQSPSVPNFDMHYVEQIFENILPCSIVTPLDCFWEGSKLLGPDYPVQLP